jgi:prenyltransferase beta subunit
MKDVTSNLTWCLECFYIADISKNDPIVKKCIERVTELQGHDGGWAPAGGEKSNVLTTINALKALKLYKIW